MLNFLGRSLHVPLGHLYVLPWRNVRLGLLTIFLLGWVVCCFDIELHERTVYFGE